MRQLMLSAVFYECNYISLLTNKALLATPYILTTQCV